MGPSQISLGVAFIAGIASFLSPCVLPLVPIYLAQLLGPSLNQTDQTPTQILSSNRLLTILHAFTFVIGFTLTFVALGASASALGSLLNEHANLLRQIGGVVLIILGLHTTGLFQLPWLLRYKKWTYRPARPGYPSSFLVGVVFAFGWTPCIGPILGSILALAASSTTLQSGVWLLLVYSLGLGIPFLALGLGVQQVSRFLSHLKPYMHKVEIVTGSLMVGMGLLVFFNLLPFLNQYFNWSLNL